MRLQGKQIAWNLGKDRSIKKEIGCELLLTWMRPWKENRAPPTTHPHPYPHLASENCFNKLLKFVWGTVSTEWLRIMAKREVSMNSQYFLHRQNCPHKNIWRKVETRENFLPRAGWGEGSCSFCSEQKELSSHQSISVMEQKPDATRGKTTIPVFLRDSWKFIKEENRKINK